MSDQEDFAEKPFVAEIAKQGRAICKKCKQKCIQGEPRIARLVPNPFGEGKMKNWYHVACVFEVFLKQRVQTKRISDPEDDIEGWETLDENIKNDILLRIEDCNKYFETKQEGSTISLNIKKTKNKKKLAEKTTLSVNLCSSDKDNQFREFRKLVADITNVNSYLEKTSLVSKVFTKEFKGDVILWCRLLLPGVVKRVYNLQSKQLVKLFSKIFYTDHDAMLKHLELGDVSETIQEFFQKSKYKPCKKSTLTLYEVDQFLEKLSHLTKEDDQISHFKEIIPKCTANDLKILIRLIKHDLRMNAGAKHVLDGIHAEAYQAFQSSRDIEAVINRCLGKDSKTYKAKIELMTPVLPMLAEACKSVEHAFKKCPNGMYSEIKYDGERVQVHKKGSEFRYFSRSLKPVLPHKVAHFKNYIPLAFPHANDLILDSEILMVNTQTGEPLPFGSLGIHKKNEFKDASVCLFVFDCIYYNGEILTNKPIEYRKKILKETMTEIPNHIVFSEMEEIHDRKDLINMIVKVLKLGLEGLVLKDLKSIYEPGKRHWLKVKKDYLFDGAMADSADLIVLGAWYGTGKKGGIMSIFLMGCYDQDKDKFCTVCKVSTGHDDKTLERLQIELDMIKIASDPCNIPSWLHCTKLMMPDFIAKDPKNQPVWEITGAEFTQHDIHTADGISIRFPRVTKIRSDKNWNTATTLKELKELFFKSKEHTDVSLLMKDISQDVSETSTHKNKTDILKKFVKRSHVGENFVVESECPRKQRKIDIKNPLPNYLKNINILIKDNLRKKESQWFRYFVAYGGVICKNRSADGITYVVHSKNVISLEEQKYASDVKHVNINWLKECIVRKSVCDFKPYQVKLTPS